MRVFFILSIGLLCLAAGVMSQATSGQTPQRNQIPVDGVKRVVIFGDATSDFNNVYHLTGETVPDATHFDGNTGTFSNGDLYWQQLLSKHLWWLDQSDAAQVQSWAYGGAGVDSVAFPHTSAAGVPGLKQQVEQYLSTVSDGIPSGTLFLIMEGQNDYLLADPAVFASQATAGAYVASVVGSYASTLQMLTLSSPNGGVWIVSVSMTALGDVPATAAAPASQRSLLSQLTNVHNANVRQVVLALDGPFSPAIRNIYLDVTAEYARLRSNPNVQGFEQGPNGSPCLPSPAATQCSKPSRYFWWDALHYSESGHGFIADRIWADGFKEAVSDDSSASSLLLSFATLMIISLFALVF